MELTIKGGDIVEVSVYHSQIINKLRGLRAERRLSLDKVSKGTSVGRDTLSLYEMEKRKIPLKIVLELLKVYDVEPYIFFRNIFDNSRERN